MQEKYDIDITIFFKPLSKIEIKCMEAHAQVVVVVKIQRVRCTLPGIGVCRHGALTRALEIWKIRVLDTIFESFEKPMMLY